MFHALFTPCNSNSTNILQKEEPINNGKVEDKKEEVTTNGNEEDDENGKTRRRGEDANGRASSIERKNTIVHHQETAQERTKGCVIM